MENLKLKAGPKAFKILQERGLRKEDIKVIPGAAGGPKWLILYELDRYIFGEFLKNKKEPLDLIGASAGAWRMACACQNDPIKALEHFYHSYVNQRYDRMPTAEDVQKVCNHIVKETLGKNGVDEILNNKNKRLHVITSRSKFGYPKDKIKRKYYEIVLANTLSRKNLNRYFERCIFSNTNHGIVDIEDDLLNTKEIKVSKEDLPNAMLASGAIPGVIEPVQNIKSAPGIHWDGGVTDYHLDLPYKMDDGLILYPHFENRILAGWLDKFVPFRKTRKKNLEHMLLLYPSKSFVQSLPMKKITERVDFETYFLKDDERIELWNATSEQCKVLAEELESIVNGNLDLTKVERF